MCYSKEVQLLTGLIIWLIITFFYFFYKNKYVKSKEKWLLPFINSVLMAFVFIGGHQFFEFLSLATNNTIIYKTGLFVSMFALYYGVRALGILLNKEFHSKIILYIVLVIGITQYFLPASFEATSFYVRHFSPLIWSGFWTFVLIYIHLCAFSGRSELKDEQSKRTILLFLIAFVDVSVILGVLYYFFGYWQFGVNICYDMPSIWCTFGVIQLFFLPLFLSALPSMFKHPVRKTFLSWKKTILFFIISAIITIGVKRNVPNILCVIS